ncbi:MAG TPA: hypothetical protein VKY34_07355 [Xanthomarina sp.]|nr:hypothetical protein [Xanthomarina sp.]
MTTNEKQFLEDNILKVILDNKEGLTIDTILEYLDYINKVAYHRKEVVSILERLVCEQKILKKGNIFISKSKFTNK